MFTYTGNGSYCFANSLHMCLHAAGMAEVPEVSFLECLTLMPFGTAVYGDQFLPSGPNTEPDSGLSHALRILGWTADEQFGGSPDEALARLREGLKSGLVLAGPLDMGHLTYVPDYGYLGGADHFVAVMDVDGDRIRVHDPQGFPHALLPMNDWLAAWRAETIPYGRHPYMMRSHFRRAETVSRTEMILRLLPEACTNLTNAIDGPDMCTGVAAFQRLHGWVLGADAERVRHSLSRFAFPLGARRCLDGATFFAEAGRRDLAALMAQKSRLYGRAQYPVVAGQWDVLAGVIEELIDTEMRLIEKAC